MNRLSYYRLNERDYDTEERRELASKGQALPDGSFPIANKKDLENAIKSYGLSKDKERAKKWIEKRAKELGATDMLPSNWD